MPTKHFQYQYPTRNQFRATQFDEMSYMGRNQYNTHHNWSTQGQYMDTEEYAEEEYDYEQDWIDHPWNVHEMEVPFTRPPMDQGAAVGKTHQPKQQEGPSYNQDGIHDKQTNRDFHRPPPPLPQQQQQQQPPQPQQQQSHQFGSQIQHQHRAVARGPKLHFPEFTGEDCDGWIRKAEKYFELVGIPNEDRVRIAVLYVSGKAEYWWRGTGCNANTLPWHHFCRMVGDRFNQVSEYEIIGQFHNLKQVGSVVDYVDIFEEMVSMVRRNNPALPDTYYISSFISGLKDYIQYHLQCYRPTTLSQAYWYAKRLEQAQPPFKKFSNFPGPVKVQKNWSKENEKEASNPTIADLRVAGKCFKCREPWVPGHTKVCKGKQLYSVILVQNEEGKEEVAVIVDADQEDDAEFQDAENIPTVQISMHALSGSYSPASSFTLKLQIGNKTAIALVDSGSDASFINAKFAVKAKCKIQSVSEVKVAAATGAEMLSETACLKCPYSIQGHQFSSDFRLLEVQGYDVVLGAD